MSGKHESGYKMIELTKEGIIPIIIPLTSRYSEKLY